MHRKRPVSLEAFHGDEPAGEGGPRDSRPEEAPIAAPSFFTVSELSDLIEADLREDPRLRGVFVKGEISGLREYPKAWYFSLKDEDAVLSAVVWKGSSTREVGALLKEGAEVIARGDVNTYRARSNYQLRVTEIQSTDKRGALFLKFEQTKKKLEAEGLFDESLKRPLPAFPATVGVVTSLEGAVLRDIYNVIERRFPHVRILVAPSRVQGEGAEKEVIRGIEWLNRVGGVDVIIVARGGGSIEDLWPFNEESLARAVRASALPVISAVGHQTDFTICDFVADFRAPTPSAAAEIIVPNAQDLLGSLRESAIRLARGLRHTHEVARQRFERLATHYAMRLPRSLLESRQQLLDEVTGRLMATSTLGVERARAHLDKHAAALDVLSPLKTLARGYAIAVTPEGRVVRRAEDVSVGQDLGVVLSEGELSTKVTARTKGRFVGARKES
jgi:exodeoxyribonuclease VII large subunit